MKFSGLIQNTFETDILVIGAGSAGAAAAIAAAQGKYKVTLVEHYGFPGGSSTQMLDTFYGFFTPSEIPKKIVGGIPDKIVNKLDSTGDIFLRPNTYGAGTGVNYNPERLKQVYDQFFLESGIDVYYHTTLVGVEKKQEHSECVFFYKSSGFFSINAKRIIDASGDADFCHWAGLRYEVAGENDPVQSMTTTFRMANVDLKIFENAGGKKLLKSLMIEAVESKSHALPRKEGSAHEMNIAGCISTVAVKVVDKNALDVKSITEAEMEGRNQSFVYERFFREKVPGFENSKIITLSTQIGVRETRRVYGKYRLTKEDCISGKKFHDQVLLCGAPVEDHRKSPDGSSETYWQYIPDGGTYGVPYRTLIPENSNNIWAIGRCFSATHDAHASCRSMAQTMSMGQAAGLAATLSIEKDTNAEQIPFPELQDRLIKVGAVLEEPNKPANINRNGWKSNF